MTATTHSSPKPGPYITHTSRPGRFTVPASLRILIASAAAVAALALPAAASANPTVTIDPVASHSITTAQVSGTVKSGGKFKNATEWFFQTSTDGGITWTPNTYFGGLGGVIFNDNTTPVGGTLIGLTASEPYEVRLAAVNDESGGKAESAPVSFETDPAPNPPSLKLGAAENPSFQGIHLSGSFNPEGGNDDPVAGPIPLTARLEVNREGQGWTPVGSPLTVEGAQAISTEDIPIEAEPTSLNAGSEYEFRLTVTYAGLEKFTPPGEFSTVFLPKPTVSGPAVSEITTQSAHFAGEVDPGSSDPLSDTSWHFQCTPSCGGLQGGTIPAGASGEEVKVANDAELEPNVTYTVSLVASNAAGQVEKSETFTTIADPPLVKAFAAGPIQADRAGINGEIDPENSPTTYWFEWGTHDCSANPCQSLPASKEADAGSAGTFAYVFRELTGLSPETTYHFRLLAKNSVGTTEGDDQTFTTASLASESSVCPNPNALGAAELPDCRAWEMVSPTDKHGGSVATVSGATRAADDGEAIGFTSSVGFSDVRGTIITTEYLSQRDGRPGTNGWSTHGITPPQKSYTFETAIGGFGEPLPGYKGDFSADTSRGVFVSFHPLTGAPNVAAVPNLYLRNDLTTPGAGSYQLLSDSVAPAPEMLPYFQLLFGVPRYVGGSSDLSHVVFESRYGLTEGSSFDFQQRKLYESFAGTVRLVGRIPAEAATSCDDAGDPSLQCIDAPSAAGIPAGNQQYSSRMVSDDGSRILFASGSNIYMRENGTKTFQLNVSEKEPPAPIERAATLWDASQDGSRIFFTTNDNLVDEDERNESYDLYMYDVTKPEGEHLTLLSIRDLESGATGVTDVESVIGASDDGHYIYYYGTDRTPSGEVLNIYLWHDGDISWIGGIHSQLIAALNTPRAYFGHTTDEEDTKTSRVSPDGRHLLFMTTSDEGVKAHGGFPGYDHGGNTCSALAGGFPCRELYIYDADSGRLRCASCNPSGAAATVDAKLYVRGDSTPMSISSHQSNAVSDDGRYVFFSSAERLVPTDTNGTLDAYVYDTTSEDVHLLSSGEDRFPSYLMDASADGRDAFIATSERLSRWDVDTSYDIYDARVGGGLPEPELAPPACLGDACQPNPIQLNDPTPASSSFRGAGNPTARRCPQSSRKFKSRNGKGRCVKSPTKGKRHKRDTKHDRRAGR